jgi:mono/diheme cytochrome c family protein
VAGRHLVIAAIALAAAVSLAGCDDLPGKPDPARRRVPLERSLNFTVLYASRCAGCHGENGTLGPAPPLNDPLFRQIIPETALRQVISAGRQGTPMPSFSLDQDGTLTPQQIDVLVQGVQSHWGEASRSGKPPAYEAAGKGDATAGARIFAVACAACHGDHGQGSPEGHVGAIRDSAFLALISDQALRRIIITGRPDLGMPSYSGKDGRSENFEPLSSEQIDDLVALLAAWRQKGGKP